MVINPIVGGLYTHYKVSCLQRCDEFIPNIGELMSLPGTCEGRTRQQLQVDTMIYNVPTMTHQIFVKIHRNSFVIWIHMSFIVGFVSLLWQAICSCYTLPPIIIIIMNPRSYQQLFTQKPPKVLLELKFWVYPQQQWPNNKRFCLKTL